MYHLLQGVGLTLLLHSPPSIGEAVRHPIGDDACQCAVAGHVAVRIGQQFIDTGIDHTRPANALGKQAEMVSSSYLASENAERQRTGVAKEKPKREQDLKLAQENMKREEDAKRGEEDDKRKTAAALEAEQDKLKAIRQAQLEKEESIRLERLRMELLERFRALAGAAGQEATQCSPRPSLAGSNSYGRRLSAVLKPNIVFTADDSENPIALVEVRAAPNGTIVGRKLLKSSGNKDWDDAVLKAIDRTARLPLDVDCKAPALLEISFRRRD